MTSTSTTPEQHQGDRTKRRRQGRALALLAVAGIVTAGAAAVATRPTGSEGSFGPVTAAPLIGEHSALGPKLVDDLNATIAAMGHLRGEHAGLSQAEYKALAGLP
jgi:hypothetical protein